MIEQNISNKELSEAVGIPRAALSRLKNGQNLSFDNMVKITQYLGCQMNDIMDIIENPVDVEVK